jgi:hypothetical protein
MTRKLLVLLFVAVLGAATSVVANADCCSPGAACCAGGSCCRK